MIECKLGDVQNSSGTYKTIFNTPILYVRISLGDERPYQKAVVTLKHDNIPIMEIVCDASWYERFVSAKNSDVLVVAMDIFRAVITHDSLTEIIDIAHHRGVRAGITGLQEKIKDALGLED